MVALESAGEGNEVEGDESDSATALEEFPEKEEEVGLPAKEAEGGIRIVWDKSAIPRYVGMKRENWTATC